MPTGATECPSKSTAGGMAAETGTAPTNTGRTSCSEFPCAASLLGDVALTTVAGTGLDGATFAVGENIYGPYEAGFTSTQKNILIGMGCTDENVANAYLEGGIDTHVAEQMVAKGCGITLPRTDGDTYVSLIDECGGHTRDYHFHERLSCLYEEKGTHSAKIGEALDGKPLYGKWEDYATKTLPLLDSCGGHFGVTPDSNGKVVYHYHVQVRAPFTIGCFGPSTDEATGNEKLVTLAECRNLYNGCSSSSTINKLDTTFGIIDYKYWCPCYDATGSNVGTQELPVFSKANATVICDGCKSGGQLPASASTSATSVAAAFVSIVGFMATL